MGAEKHGIDRKRLHTCVVDASSVANLDSLASHLAHASLADGTADGSEDAALLLDSSAACLTSCRADTVPCPEPAANSLADSAANAESLSDHSATCLTSCREDASQCPEPATASLAGNTPKAELASDNPTTCLPDGTADARLTGSKADAVLLETDSSAACLTNGLTNPDASLAGGTADAVLLVFTLSAVPPCRMEAVLRHAYSSLRPGGLLLFRDYAEVTS